MSISSLRRGLARAQMAFMGKMDAVRRHLSSPPRGGPLGHPLPIVTQVTPDTVLQRSKRHWTRVGRRHRLATCGGVAWLDSTHLAIVNLTEVSIRTWRFDPLQRTLEVLQVLIAPEGLDLPENLAVSPNRRLIAVTNSAHGLVSVYRLDPVTLEIDPVPTAKLRNAGDWNPHGVSFSPCSRFLLYSTVDEPGCMRLYRLRHDGSDGVDLEQVQEIPNAFAPAKPKGVAYSPDGRFVAACHGQNVGRGSQPAQAFVGIYRVGEDGRLGDHPISRSLGSIRLGCVEDVDFFADGGHLLVTDQMLDRVVSMRFDPATGTLGEETGSLERPWSPLSFPHGNAISPDGKFLAVTNYGSDSFAIHALAVS